MQKSLPILVFLFGCVGCQDKQVESKRFEKRYADLVHIFQTGDIHSAEGALVGMESLVSNEGKSFFTADGLPLELCFLRARRSQIAQRLGDHARAQELMSEALALAHQAGKNTNSGPAGLLEAVERLDAKKTIQWKQTTN